MSLDFFVFFDQYGLMKILALLSALIVALFPTTSLASTGSYRLFELDEVDLGYKSFFPGGSDPLLTQNGLPDRGLGKEVQLKLDTSLFKYLYFNNRVHGATDEVNGKAGQFRTVGWEFRLGVAVYKLWGVLPVEVGYYHHSQHLLDTTYEHGHFPVQDALELNFILYKK